LSVLDARQQRYESGATRVISEKFGCVFVHIPKTAGQSIENFFLAWHGLTWKERARLLIKRNGDPACGPEQLAHMTAQEYLDFGYLTSDTFDSYFKFAFVRNPWERLVSEYKFMKEYHERHSFKEFVLRGLPRESAYLDSYRHITPQCEFLYNSDGKLMVDFVGRFEHLQSDFDYVCKRLGIEDSLLPHVNSSRERHSKLKKRLKRSLSGRNALTKPYTWYYDTQLIDRVGEMYDADISAFGYRFGG
jgi:hypothetical protein